jgi:histidine triad (HIT) family protein
MSCIFCDIVNSKAPAHVIWQDDKFIAFLSIYPNTLGTTVVIPKVHYDSYIFDMEHDLMAELMVACKKVANLLDTKLNTKRCAVIFEGMGINHLHAKLFPLHGLKDTWESMDSIPEIKQKYFKTYEGYVSSHDGMRADDETLSKIAYFIKS